MKRMINIRNEIAPLKKVLLHRPGNELMNLTPNMAKRMLFDDLMDLNLAQKEHDAMASILRKENIEVLYLVDLVVESLNINANIREKFIKQFIKESGITSKNVADQVYSLLNAINDNKKLVYKCIEGISKEELHANEHRFYQIKNDDLMLIEPLSNLYATRDAWTSLGNMVSLHKMHSKNRHRETIFGEFIFKYHPRYKNVKLVYDRYDHHFIEGGDILVLNDEVICIAISEKTESSAIAKLGEKLLKESNFKYIIAIELPEERSKFHLDMVLNRVDFDKFLIDPKIINLSGIFELTLVDDQILVTQLYLSLEEALEKYLHLEEITLIKCGDNKSIISEREQWSAGVNVLCIKPGVVVAYERNYVTNRALKENGIRVIEVASSELLRGHCGPHSMCMPLIREK